MHRDNHMAEMALKMRNTAAAQYSQKEDITGKRFGMLVAVCKSENRAHGQKAFMWRFRCDCGNVVEKIKFNVVMGSEHQSCGCLPDLRVKRAHAPRLDIAGHRFGALVAIGPVTRTVQGWTWAFLCDCGMVTLARRKDVTNGNTASCGCLQGRKYALNLARPWGANNQELP